MLADLTHQKKQKALKALRGYIHRGWLSAWLDEKDEKLYLTAEDYRAAQEARKAAEQAPRPEPQPEDKPVDKKSPLRRLLDRLKGPKSEE